MAQRQYTPAARGRGFNAITVSNANLSQLEAESNRVLEGMRARRDADLQNKKQILQDMQDNANYYDKVRKRDFNIASTNNETQQRQAQYDEAERFKRYQEASSGAAKVFESLSSLSNIAAQKAGAIQKEKDKEEFDFGVQQGIARAGEFNSEQLTFLAQVYDQANLSDLLENNAQLAKERGFDPNAVAKIINMSVKQRSGFLFGALTQDTATNYSTFYNNQLGNPELTVTDPTTGQPVPYSEVTGNPSLLAIAQAEIASSWVNQRQYPQNHEMLSGVYKQIASIHSSHQTVAQNAQTQNLNADTLARYSNAAYTDWDGNGGAAFRVQKNINGPEAAHTWLKESATAMNPDGTFVLTDEQWKSTDVYGTGASKGRYGRYDLDFKKRTLEIQNARQDKQTAWNLNQTKTDSANYQRESRDWWEEWQRNQTLETLAAAEESFSDNQEGPPEWIKRAREGLKQGQYVQNLKLAAKDAEQRGILTQALVTEIYGYDPKEGNRLQEVYDKQNPFTKNEIFTEQRKGVTKLTKKPSAAVPFPQDSSHSLHAGRILSREFDKLVSDLAVQYGGGQAAIEKASVEAAGIIEDRIAKDATNVKGKYYREYDVVTGLFKFPNLKDEKLTPTQEAKEAAIQFQDAINRGKRQELINTKFGVLTETELDTELKNFNQPGYTPNVKLVQASKGVEGGLPAVLRRQAFLAGRENELGDMPESLQRVGAYSPSAQRLLQKYLNAEVSTRIHGYEGGKLAVEWNRHIVPAQYRESIETHAKTFGVTPAILSAQLEVESSWDPNAGSVAGARGLAQFMPETARQYGVDVRNPDSSIKGMANYMMDLTQQFGDPIIAAGAYNAGPGRMREYLENGRPLPAETVNHMRKVAKAYYKYSGDSRVLSNPHVARAGTSFQAANMAATYEGMDTSAGPDAGENACVYAINKVLRASGIQPPWGDDLYVPTVKANLDANAKQISGPVPGAIVIMQDNGTPPYPHIGIVGNDGLIISNSSSERKFNWKMTPAEYEQYYGKPNLYYRLN
jgi:hypothetical protein